MQLKFLVTMFALLVSLPVMAEEPSAELQALAKALPGKLINDPTRLDWDVFGPGQSNKPVRSKDIPGGGGAIQITVPRDGATLYEIGTNAPLTEAVAVGTDMVVTFWARTIKADTQDGKGRIGVRFQQNAAPYPGFGDTTLVIGSDWAQYEVSARANRALPKGQGVLGFQLSGAKQIIEIGQAIVVAGVTTLKGKTPQPAVVADTALLPQLQGRGTLISNPSDKVWTVYGAGQTSKSVLTPRMPGTGGTSLQVTATVVAKNPFDLGVVVPITAAIKEGDVLLIAVLAHAISAETPDGLAKLGLRVQRNEAPYPGFGEQQLSLGPNWKLLQLRTQAKMDIPEGKAVVALHFGAARQVIEIGQVYVLKTAPPAAQ